MEDELLKLLKRKRKAESLPKEEFKRWKPKYDEIINRIIELEKNLNIPFDDKKANELIDYMSLFGPGGLERHEIEFLNNNRELDTRYGMKLLEIDRIYNERKSITELEKAINEYVEIWKEIIEKAKG